jgi:ribosome biogenesis protein UTP30
MAKTKSKTVAKKTEKVETPVEAPLTTKATNGSPYQLDPSQVERAAKALVAHMKKHVEEKEAEAPKKNLADDEDEAEENDQPIFLSLATKAQIGNTKSMKPVAMLVRKPLESQRTTDILQQATALDNRQRRPDMHLH